MDPHQPDRTLIDRGISSVQFLLASGLGMILFLVLANFVVVQYGRGAIRSALDQGARAGAVSGSVSGCESKISEVLDQLLGGSMGDDVVAECGIEPSQVTASATAVFESWTPLSPDIVVTLDAYSIRGPAP